MQAFEIHTFKDGQWKIDSVFDDRELALHEARKVDESGRYSSLRVIEENYDEVSDLTTTRTIFRGGKAKQIAKSRRTTPTRSSSNLRGGAGKEPMRKGRSAKQKQKTNLLVPILLLIIVVMAGVGGLIAMQYLGAQK